MAGYLVRIERMFPSRLRRNPLFWMIAILCGVVFLLHRGISLLTTPPKLFNDAMKTLNGFKNHNGGPECSLKLRNIDSYIVHIQDVIIDQSKVSPAKRNTNTFKIHEGFFSVFCTGDSNFKGSVCYGPKSHFCEWGKSVKTVSPSTKNDAELVEGLSFAVIRQPTNNIYLTILDMYDTYVSIRMTKQSPKEANILLIDSYQEGPSDDLWGIVFGEVVQLKDISLKHKFEDLIWTVPSQLSPIVALDVPLPYMDDFRHHVVTSGGAVTSDELQCESLKITFSVNEDSRFEIENFFEIYQIIKKNVREHEVVYLSHGTLGMREHIQTIASTDILIGLHGDALGNAFLLHRGSGLIELFPTRYRLKGDDTFKRLTDWGGIFYISWFNRDLFLRDRQSMHVDPGVIMTLISNMKRRMCN